jgi:hypothetical protein
MAFVRNPLEEPEKSLRDYASPRCEDIKVQESDLVLQATRYEIKPRIIEMATTNPFRGVETDNPYRHIQCFTTLCNTVRQDETPMIGLNGISSTTHLPKKQLSGIHLRPSKSREIGMN